MKNYKKLVTSFLLMAIVLISPTMALAKANNDDNSQKNNIAKTEKVNKNWFGSSWFKNKSPKNIGVSPIISNVEVTASKSHKATISWNTDIKSNSLVWFSATSGIDTNRKADIKRDNKVLKHKIELNKLQPNTKYYLIVGSATKNGIVKSSEVSFTTSDKVITAKALSMSEIVSTVDTTSAKITWNTNKPTTSNVFYSINTPVNTADSATPSVKDSVLTKKHSVNISGLSTGTLYHIIIKSTDSSNNEIVSDEHEFKTN